MVKGVGRKLSRGGGEKKDRKIALLSLFQGGGATEKRPKNSTFKFLSTIFVPCMKIQGSHGPLLPPAADTHEHGRALQGRT